VPFVTIGGYQVGVPQIGSPFTVSKEGLLWGQIRAGVTPQEIGLEDEADAYIYGTPYYDSPEYKAKKALEGQQGFVQMLIAAVVVLVVLAVVSD